MRPRCVIVTGRPGSGKTTLAPRLADRLHLPLVSRDAVKEGYIRTQGIGHDDLPADTNVVVSRLWSDIVMAHLEGNVSIVIEAAFQHQVWAANIERFRRVSEPTMVLCSVPLEVARSRYTQRAETEPDWVHYHGQATSTQYIEPDLDIPTIRVSTEVDYEPSIDSIAETVLRKSGD
jgi:adenylate kinase family enzyme